MTTTKTQPTSNHRGPTQPEEPRDRLPDVDVTADRGAVPGRVHHLWNRLDTGELRRRRPRLPRGRRLPGDDPGPRGVPDDRDNRGRHRQGRLLLPGPGAPRQAHRGRLPGNDGLRDGHDDRRCARAAHDHSAGRPGRSARPRLGSGARVAGGGRERDGVPDRPALARLRLPFPVRTAVPHRPDPQVARCLGPDRLRAAHDRGRSRDLRSADQPGSSDPRRDLRGDVGVLAAHQGLHAGGVRRGTLPVSRAHPG